MRTIASFASNLRCFVSIKSSQKPLKDGLRGFSAFRGLNHKPPKFPSLQLQSVEQRIQVNRFAAILEGVVPAQ